MQRDERVLVVWAYNFDDIIPACRDFEERLVQFLLSQRPSYSALVQSVAPSATASAVFLDSDDKVAQTVDEKPSLTAVVATSTPATKQDKARTCPHVGVFHYFVSSKDDVERIADGPSARPMRLLAPFYSGLAGALSFGVSQRLMSMRSKLTCHIHNSIHRKWSVRVDHGIGLRRDLCPLGDSCHRPNVVLRVPGMSHDYHGVTCR